MTLHWQPFQLRPETPPGGMPLSAMLPRQYLERADASLQAATRAANLPLNRPLSGPNDPLVPNTHLAHEAGAFAEEHGKGDAFHRATLRAYFGAAQDIGRPEVLVAIGESVGLDAEALSRALADGTYREAVDRELAMVQEFGITGVPTFLFGPGLAFSGAHPYDVFQRAMAAAGYAPNP